jgi:nicotinamide-nucleotide amidase
MTAALLCIGTELVRGEIVNSNASWIAGRLTELGRQVATIESIADDRARIGASLRRLGREHSLVVCTGGLGPTTDDLTTETVAELLGVPLERDGLSLQAIQARMARFGRTMAASNAKQADLPRGARVLPNAHGTAPGFSIQIGRAQAFFLPGVPREMQAMFDRFVTPEASRRGGVQTAQIRLRTFGLPESEVNDRLAGLEAHHDVALAYRAHFPEIEVKLRAEASSADQALHRARAGADEVIRRLGHEVVFSDDGTSLAEVVGTMLVARGLRLATAESCTGGLVAQQLTDSAGASRFFLGGAVTYADAAKQHLLGVDARLLQERGAVSTQVAQALAQGARARFGADVALALTGIAGPSGGTADKPVGTVYYAVATAESCRAAMLDYPGSRSQIRLRAAYSGLGLVRKLLLDWRAEE